MKKTILSRTAWNRINSAGACTRPTWATNTPFKYFYGNGDSYQGTVYRTAGAAYYPGWKSTPKANETGKLGYYQILSMAYTGATAKYKQVFVDTYHDGESNKDFTPAHKGQVVGSAYLGSEWGISRMPSYWTTGSGRAGMRPTPGTHIPSATPMAMVTITRAESMTTCGAQVLSRQG